MGPGWWSPLSSLEVINTSGLPEWSALMIRPQREAVHMAANAQWSESWFLGVEGYTQSSSSTSNLHLQVTLCIAQEGMVGLVVTTHPGCALS